VSASAGAGHELKAHLRKRNCGVGGFVWFTHVPGLAASYHPEQGPREGASPRCAACIVLQPLRACFSQPLFYPAFNEGWESFDLCFRRSVTSCLAIVVVGKSSYSTDRQNVSRTAPNTLTAFIGKWE